MPWPTSSTKTNFTPLTTFVVKQLRNSFEKQTKLLHDLYRSKEQDQGKLDELAHILEQATTRPDERNEFLHARWGIPDTASGGVVRIKFDLASGCDTVKPVKPGELAKIVDGLETCTEAATPALLESSWRLSSMAYQTDAEDMKAFSILGAKAWSEPFKTFALKCSGKGE